MGICTITLTRSSDALDVSISASSPGLIFPSTVTVPARMVDQSFIVWRDTAYGAWITLTATLNGLGQSIVITPATGAGFTAAAQMLRAVPTSCKPGSITAEGGGSCPSSLADRRPLLHASGRQLVKYGTQVRFRVVPADSRASISSGPLPSGAFFDGAAGIFEWFPAASDRGIHDLTFTATDASGATAAEHVTLEVDSGTPQVNAVVNAATRARTAACSPGAIGSLQGRWLISDSPASDPSGVFYDLSGTRVIVNGAAVPVVYASATRVDFICPDSVPGITLEIVVETPRATTQPVRTVSSQFAPGVFSLDGSGSGPGFIVHPDLSTLVVNSDGGSPGRAAHAGDSIVIYATGITGMTEVAAVVAGTEIKADSVEPVAGIAGLFRVSLNLPQLDIPQDGTGQLHLLLRMPDGSSIRSNTVDISLSSVDAYAVQ